MSTAKHKPRPRTGIILLVVLGVLALFSILTVTFLSFASTSRQTAFNTARREFRNPKPEFLMEEAVMQIIRGTTNPQSALFRHDLLGDYYGYQTPDTGVPLPYGEALQVTPLSPNILQLGSPGPGSPIPPFDSVGRGGRDRGVLVAGGAVVKVPVRFTQRQPPAAAGAVSGITPQEIPENVVNRTVNSGGSNFPISSPLCLDDALTGRTATWLAGPLENTTLRIIRWCGHRNPRLPSGAVNPQLSFRYSMFLDFDVESLPERVILGDGAVVNTASLINPNSGATQDTAACLFYSPGPPTAPQLWGEPGVDDDGNGVTDDYSEAGWPDSDDVPYNMVINPVPRNGAGVMSSTTAVPLGGGVSLPAVLQPRYGSWWAPGATIMEGDADEPWDAPDLENMYLSYQGENPAGGSVIIPSFHRPSLVNHLINSGTYGLGTPQLQSAALGGASLRPIPLPNVNRRFTGGNDAFIWRVPHDDTSATRVAALSGALINGPWDVDNDGDGINDSVWIDPQLPLVTAEDGTRLRPLIAVQIEDLGSKFNLNAHGSRAQLSPDFLRTLLPTEGPFAGNLPGGPGPGGGGLVPVNLPVGRGFGPSEIFPLLSARPGVDIDGSGRLVLPAPPQFRLYNALDSLLNIRYANFNGTERAPGTAGNEAVDAFLHPNQPPLHNRLSVHGLPLDRHGRGLLAIDATGNLVSAFAGFPVTGSVPPANEVVNDPYEFNPAELFSSDAGFTLADYERLLERHRWQQYAQPSRLDEAIGPLLDGNPQLARLVTPVSSSDAGPPQLPVNEHSQIANSRLEFGAQALDSTSPLPPGTVPLSASERPTSLVEAILSRVIRDTDLGGNDFARSRGGGPVIGEEDIALMNLLLAPELQSGGRLDINRPFGNGVDDNGNAQIDEPYEPNAGHGGFAIPANYNLRPVPPALRTANAIETPREALARHLYCLVMLVMNDEEVQKNRWRRDTANITGGGAPNASPSLLDRYVARRVAQWAVNVVDYRDPDGIMTRFEYDIDPFNGWNTTGPPPPPGTPWNPANPNPPERGVVFGCEHPELVMMESFAMHDVNVKDTDWEGGGGGDTKSDGDPNCDQVRKPEGSAFLELFAARPPTTVNAGNHEALPTELYDFAGGVASLDLDRLAPPRDSNGNGDFNDIPFDTPAMPVWRIAISGPQLTAPLDATDIDITDSPLVRRDVGQFPDTTSYQPEQSAAQTDHLDELQLDGGGATPVTEWPIERYVLFSSATARADLDGFATKLGVGTEAIFCDLTNGAPTAANLPIGTYLTIAPRSITRAGALADGGVPEGPSDQRFELIDDTLLVHRDATGARTTPQTFGENGGAGISIRDSRTFVAQAFIPPSWAGVPAGEVTEILTETGAPSPEVGIGFNISEPLPDAAYYPAPRFYLETTNYLRRDGYAEYPSWSTGNIANEPFDSDPDTPVGKLGQNAGLSDTDDPFIGTAYNFRTAFLQRLANPLLPFQPDPNLALHNPYITVDWMPMDLTVFSGEEDPNELHGADPSGEGYLIQSRQKTGATRNSARPPVAADLVNLLYSNRVNRPATQPDSGWSGAVGSPYFNPVPWAAIDDISAGLSVGYLNAYFHVPSGQPRITRGVAGAFPATVGHPTTPFAVHPWLNRPYASPLEVMMVPATSQGRLFEEFGVVQNPALQDYEAADYDNFRAPFEHLLNFFDGREVVDIAIPANPRRPQNPAQRAHLYRIFEYIAAGAKYRGQVEPKSPRWSEGNGGLVGPPATGAQLARGFWAEAFRFPFNAPIDNRQPGRINLNTVGNQQIFAGLMWNHLPPADRAAGANNLWQLFQQNSREHDLVSTALFSQFPTPFATPLVYSNSPGTALEWFRGGSANVDATTLTGSGTYATPSNATGFFERDESAPRPAFDDVSRNPLPRFQTLMRMKNLTTDNAHMFLVRITMGMFEFDNVTGLGKEHLVDFGRNKRYRGTYIIDRSVPVRYQTGQDTDADRTILFRRFYRN